MKARWIITTAASGALVLGLLAPGAVTAAPTATKPSGEAMVRIDGGTARAIDRGRSVYRIVLPRDAAIRWLGDADRTLTIGTLGRKGLVAGWARLGHRTQGTHAPATITFRASGSTESTYVGVRLGKPRINADGLLTFLARTTGPLPKELPDFSLNIARPWTAVTAPVARGGYPLAFPVNAASSSVGVQATATGDTTATVTFVNLSNGAVTSECSKPTAKSVSGVSPNDYINFSGTCGDVTWSLGVISFFPMQAGLSSSSSQIQMSATVIVKGSSSTFPWDFNMGQWKAGPVKVWP